jgi:hypothetical protein
MMLSRSLIKAAFVLATIFTLLVSTSKAHQSEACINETAVLHSNAIAMSSVAQITNGTLTCVKIDSVDTCSYFFSTGTIPDTFTFEAICSKEGGQPVISYFILTCTVNSTVDVPYSFEIPDCVGASCDTSVYPYELMNSTSQIESTLDDFKSLDDFKGLDDCFISTSSAPIIMGAKSFLLASTFLF